MIKMLIRVLIVIMFFSSQPLYSDGKVIKNSGEDRIFGGQKAEKGEFPYIISMSHVTYERNFTDCSATIIDEWNLITAGHCMKSSLQHYVFTPNYNNRRFDNRSGSYLGSKQYTIAQAYMNANYTENYDELINDLALIRLSEPLIFDQDIHPIKVYIGHVPPGSLLQIIGWGFKEGQESSWELRTTTIELYPPNLCDAWAYSLAKIWWPSNFCAGHSGKGICSGDSGGPIVIRGPTSAEDLLVGTVSGLLGMLCSKEPGIFNNITPYFDWLIERYPTLRYTNELPKTLKTVNE